MSTFKAYIITAKMPGNSPGDTLYVKDIDGGKYWSTRNAPEAHLEMNRHTAETIVWEFQYEQEQFGELLSYVFAVAEVVMTVVE